MQQNIDICKIMQIHLSKDKIDKNLNGAQAKAIELTHMQPQFICSYDC